MTTSEAFMIVESALLALNISTEDGPLLPAEIAGIISAEMGEDWSRIEDVFYDGKITPDQYCKHMLSLIEEYRKRKFHQKIASTLEQLALGGAA